MDDMKWLDNEECYRIEADNGYLSTDKKILDRLPKLKEQVHLHVETYAYEHLGISKDIKLRLMNSWLVVHKLGDFAPKHNHTNSLISGVLYLSVPEGSGGITFIKDELRQNALSPTINIEMSSNKFTEGTKQLMIKASDIVIFPSHLMHSVEPSQTNEPRICLAFNVLPQGKLGSDKTLNLWEIIHD
jgi:uncharacterized protein (TIGR02466 family)